MWEELDTDNPADSDGYRGMHGRLFTPQELAKYHAKVNANTGGRLDHHDHKPNSRIEPYCDGDSYLDDNGNILTDLISIVLAPLFALIHPVRSDKSRIAKMIYEQEVDASLARRKSQREYEKNEYSKLKPWELQELEDAYNNNSCD